MPAKAQRCWLVNLYIKKNRFTCNITAVTRTNDGKCQKTFLLFSFVELGNKWNKKVMFKANLTFVSVCKEAEYQCPSGLNCFNQEDICNGGIIDCPDREDERGCGNYYRFFFHRLWDIFSKSNTLRNQKVEYRQISPLQNKHNHDNVEDRLNLSEKHFKCIHTA